MSPSRAQSLDRVMSNPLTPQAERWIRIGSFASAAVIALCAMVLSYAGLHTLAITAKVSPQLALLVPIMVDGLQFVGSLGVVYSTLAGLKTWYPWMLLTLGVSISAWGNWQAAPDVATAKLLHASSPVILALVLEELLRVMRHKVHLHAQQLSKTAAPASGEERSTRIAEEPVPESRPTTPAPSRPEPHVEVDHPDHDPVSKPAPAIASRPVPPPPPPALPVERSKTDQTAQGNQTLTPHQASPKDATTETTTLEARDEPQPPPVPTTPAASAEPATPAVPTPTAQTAQDIDSTFPVFNPEDTLRDQVMAILTADPSITAAQIARKLAKDPSYTRRMVREVKAELEDTQRAKPHDLATTGPAEASASLPQELADEPSASPVPDEPWEPSTEASPTDWVAVAAVPDATTTELDDADPFAIQTPLVRTA